MIELERIAKAFSNAGQSRDEIAAILVERGVRSGWHEDSKL